MDKSLPTDFPSKETPTEPVTGGEAAEVRLVVMVTVPPALVVAENEADVDFTKSDWDAWKILISAF